MSEKIQEGSQAKLGIEPILPLIAKMSLPAMFSMLVQALYNVVDSVYVSRLGEYALSALSIVFPMQLLIVAVAVGAGVGLSSLISRRLGERRIQEAQSAADNGLYLSIFHWVIFLIFGIILSRPFCNLFAETNQVLDASTSYCTICLTGSLFTIIACSFEKIMQAGGNMMAPMWAMTAGAVTNIILDPIMIFGLLGCPAFGVAGAAYATVAGQFVSFIIDIIFMNKAKGLPVRVRFKLEKPNWKSIKNIYQVGLPSMIMQAIGSVLTLCMNAILATFSETAIAVYGVYFKLQSFIFMPVFGMNNGLMPILGYNFGAKNKDRFIQTYKYGTIIAFIIMSIGCAIFQIFPAGLMGFFNAEGDLLTVGIKCLSTISWCFPIAAICIIMGTCFQSTGHGFYSMIVSVMRQLVVIVPLAYFFSKIWGLMGIWTAFPIAEAVSLTVSVICFIRLYKAEIKPMENKEKSEL